MIGKIKRKKGFTLIELLVGIAVFSLIFGSLIGIFISAIRLQKKSLAQQDALNQLSFSFEYMGRALRMARRDAGQECLSTQDLNYENPEGDSSIQFINSLQDDDCQKFFLDNNTLKHTKDVGADGANEELPLTSPDVIIDDLRFFITGESSDENPNSQPRVTIFLKVSSPLNIELQTTISQRNLDVP